MRNKLSIVLATRNEQENIGRCLQAVKSIADEIIIYDEKSTDETVEIAKKYGARVYEVEHSENFHITKQKAIDKASGNWVLQLDADEVVTPELAKEIKSVIGMPSEEIKARRPKDKKKWELFMRHQKAIEERDGKSGKTKGEVVAFFIPRLNIFLGKALIHAGVYPDPAIRLIKKDRAHLPAKSVHEIMQVDGEVAWLFHDMKHYDSPTLARYIKRLNRYTNLHAEELRDRKVSKGIAGFINYVFLKPVTIFVKLYLRHKGFMDGIRGFLWSAFSASHFPIAYFKYISS